MNTKEKLECLSKMKCYIHEHNNNNIYLCVVFSILYKTKLSFDYFPELVNEIIKDGRLSTPDYGFSNAIVYNNICPWIQSEIIRYNERKLDIINRTEEILKRKLKNND